MKHSMQDIPFKIVLAALFFSAAVSIPQAEAATTITDGNTVVSSLTTLYADTVENCGSDSRPAFLCSGITLRATETNPAFFPWNPSPNSQVSGGVPFSWLRADSNFSKGAFSYPNGFIFYPVLSRPEDKLKVEVLCYFPVDGDTANRPTLGGCGANTFYPADSGLCHELIPKVDTAAKWYAHYTTVQNTTNGIEQHRHQCAFDVRDQVNHYGAPNFAAGVEARKLLSDADKITQNEMTLATWAQNIPEKLPIMAFYYLGGTDNESTGLANAQNDQTRFYEQTKGQFVPIIKMTLPTSFTGTATFTYSEADQGVKLNIAEKLTALYSDTVENCGSDSKPAFLCSGVTMRGTETSDSFFPWNPSPTSVTKGGVSFSWLRKDTNFATLGNGHKHGFIFYPVLQKPADSEKIEILCFFPVDGYTSYRSTLAGCGPSSVYPTNSGLCHELTPKVDTGEGWYTHYTSVSSQRQLHQCAFDVRDKVNYHAGPNFTAGIEGRNKLTITENNELILATWAQDIPKKLPMMAFFYLGGVTGEAAALADAKKDQARYYQQTNGSILPIVKITLPSTFSGTATFTYSDNDQEVK